MDIYLIYDFENKTMSSNNAHKCLVSIINEGGYNISCEDIKKNTNGKPFVYDIPLKFSISYSDNILAIAISDSEVGVDIEKNNELKNSNLIAKRLFAYKEQEYLKMTLTSKDNFYEIWTKKEAYVKYLGIGINNDFRYIDIFSIDENIRLESFKYDEYVLSYCMKDVVDIKINIHSCPFSEIGI